MVDVFFPWFLVSFSFFFFFFLGCTPYPVLWTEHLADYALALLV